MISIEAAYGPLRTGARWAADSSVLPLCSGFFCEALIAARNMAEELGEALHLAGGRCKAAVKVTLKHGAEIEGGPCGAHLQFPLVKVVPGVLDLLAEECAPQSGVRGAGDERGAN